MTLRCPVDSSARRRLWCPQVFGKEGPLALWPDGPDLSADLLRARRPGSELLENSTCPAREQLHRQFHPMTVPSVEFLPIPLREAPITATPFSASDYDGSPQHCWRTNFRTHASVSPGLLDQLAEPIDPCSRCSDRLLVPQSQEPVSQRSAHLRPIG